MFTELRQSGRCQCGHTLSRHSRSGNCTAQPVRVSETHAPNPCQCQKYEEK